MSATPLPPPSPVPLKDGETSPTSPPQPPLNEAEIRAAVLEPHSKEKCFDKRPIKYMTFSAITPINAYRYILETFVEKRVIGTKSMPFRGQIVAPSQPCPEKWSLSIPPPATAPPGNAVVEFYETANVTPCPTCAATGRIVCETCNAQGTIFCANCGGTGYYGRYACQMCMGLGRVICFTCTNSGWLTCPQCEGFFRVVLWNILTTTWTKDVKSYTTSTSGGGSGTDLSQEQLDQALYSWTEVSQVSTPEDPRPLQFPEEPEITQKAKYFVGGMMAQRDWRIFALRQAVVVIPVVKVDFKWKNVLGSFYVYGADNEIHFPVKYPGCCCGCMCCCGNSSCSIV